MNQSSINCERRGTPSWFYIQIKLKGHEPSLRVLLSLCDVTLRFSISSVSTVQDGPGPGREKDREAPGEADETDGGQGDAQRRHGDGLRCSEYPEAGLLD